MLLRLSARDLPSRVRETHQQRDHRRTPAPHSLTSSDDMTAGSSTEMSTMVSYSEAHPSRFDLLGHRCIKPAPEGFEKIF
jgi:hypothetical protein